MKLKVVGRGKGRVDNQDFSHMESGQEQEVHPDVGNPEVHVASTVEVQTKVLPPDHKS